MIPLVDDIGAQEAFKALCGVMVAVAAAMVWRLTRRK